MTGLLTDVAKAIKDCPEIAHQCELIWMGGAFGLDHHTLTEPKVGNMEPNNPFSEVNAFCDPEAADLVLSSDK